MNASPREAIDYGRFAQRLAAHRANQDPAKRWDTARLGEPINQEALCEALLCFCFCTIDMVISARKSIVT